MIRLIAGALAACALALPAAPAHADDPVGVNGCSATANGQDARAYCYFVGEPGTYTVEITSAARYAFANVTCTPFGGDPLFVNVWDVEGGYDWASGTLTGGLCTMEVASGSPGQTGGDWAHAVVYRS